MDAHGCYQLHSSNSPVIYLPLLCGAGICCSDFSNLLLCFHFKVLRPFVLAEELLSRLACIRASPSVFFKL